MSEQELAQWLFDHLAILPTGNFAQVGREYPEIAVGYHPVARDLLAALAKAEGKVTP